MEAAIHILYENEFCTIRDFLCQCRNCSLSAVEYQENFSICYIRKGTFQFRAFKNELEAYNGYCLLNKPGYTYQVAHLHKVPDQCTIITFKKAFYEELVDRYGLHINRFLKDPDKASVLVRNNVIADHLHHVLFSLINDTNPSVLQVDLLILNLIGHIFEQSKEMEPDLLSGKKADKLTYIEKAKHFMEQNYSENITLHELANHVGMSIFHFARTFKSNTSYSPYDYLLCFRLLHAGYLLENTRLSIQDIGFLVGFGDAFNFSSAFKKLHGISPSAFRKT